MTTTTNNQNRSIKEDESLAQANTTGDRASGRSWKKIEIKFAPHPGWTLTQHPSNQGAVTVLKAEQGAEQTAAKQTGAAKHDMKPQENNKGTEAQQPAVENNHNNPNPNPQPMNTQTNTNTKTMNDTQTQNGPEAQPAADNNSTTPTPVIIQLRKKPDVAPEGENQGHFYSITVLPQTIKNAGKKTEKTETNLEVVVELDATDSKKQPYRVSKTYNIEGRGVTAFQTDVDSWRGKPLTEAELDRFEPQVMLNQPVTVTISRAGEGKLLHPVITAFGPAKPKLQTA